MGSFVVAVNDLLQSYNKNIASAQSVSAPFLVTSARQQQLDQIVNSIPISSSVVISPTATQAQQVDQSTTTSPSQTATGTTKSTAIKPTTPITATPTPTPTPTPTAPIATPVTTPTPAPVAHTTASSDRRLKQNIKYLTTVLDDIKIYSFSYIGDSKQYVGVMAQELKNKYSFALEVDIDGYYRVSYWKLGLNMVSFKEWMTNKQSIFIN
jgi:hypothetical protein